MRIKIKYKIINKKTKKSKIKENIVDVSNINNEIKKINTEDRFFRYSYVSHRCLLWFTFKRNPIMK